MATKITKADQIKTIGAQPCILKGRQIAMLLCDGNMQIMQPAKLDQQDVALLKQWMIDTFETEIS